MAVDVGNLLVRVGADISDMQRKLDQVQGEVSKTSQHVSKSAKLMDAAFKAAALAGVAIAAKRFMDLGAAVEETASKFRTVMGPATDEVQGFLDDFATTAGLTNSRAQDLVATTAAIAQGMGFAQREAASFSTEILTLAADLGSFNNLPTEEVIQAVNSALAGEREQLKRLGIVIRETDVQQRALLNSGKETAAALTQQEKATATLQLITERAGVAVGDLARTQDSAANTARRVEARLGDLRDKIAQALLPAFAQLMGELDSTGEMWDDLNDGVDKFGVFVIFAVEHVQKFIQYLRAAGAAAELFNDIIRAIGTDATIEDAWDNFNATMANIERNMLDIEASRRRALELQAQENHQQDKIADAAERTADAVERAANAQARIVEFTLGAPTQSLSPTGRSLDSGLGFELPELKIPEFLKTTAEMEEAAESAGLAIGDMGQATRVLTGDLGKFVGSIMSGGVIGGLLAGINSIINSAEAAKKRIEAAARAVADAIDAYVNELADMDRFQRAEHDAIEGARNILQAFADQITAGIKSDKLREQIEKQFDQAIESMDLDQIRRVLLAIGTDEALAVLAELERRLDAVNKEREEEARLAQETADAIKLANEARRNELREDGLHGVVGRIVGRIGDELARIDFMFGGDLAAGFDPAVSAFQKIRDLVRDGLLPEGVGEQLAADIAEINRLFEEGLISGVEAARLINIILGQASNAQEDYAETIKRSTEAALAAARAEQFRQMVDTENLRVRLLTMQGRNEEAMVLRQSLELLEAVEQGRSAEYIAILQQIHAEERAAYARQQATESMERQTRAAEEAKRAIDGVSRVLNGPAGFTFALYRNRALRGGGAGIGPVGGMSNGGSNVRVEAGAIVVNAAPGQDSSEIADQVLAALSGTVDRRLRAGGFNPLMQSREGF